MTEMVKRLNIEHIEEIIPLRMALQKIDFENNLGIEETLLENKTREYLKENLEKNLYMFGLYVNQELVSICGLSILTYFPQANDLSGKVGYITSVYTKESYRNKGYQKRVFLECLQLGKELGISRFKLSTKNSIALTLYQSVGFKADKNAYKMYI